MSAEVKDVMTTRVVAVKMATTFKEMATRLRQHRVSAFPVVDDDERVVGVVSEADVLSVYSRPDAEIQRVIQDLVKLNQHGPGCGFPRRSGATRQAGCVIAGRLTSAERYPPVQPGAGGRGGEQEFAAEFLRAAGQVTQAAAAPAVGDAYPVVGDLDAEHPVR
jgi:CBS domain